MPVYHDDSPENNLIEVRAPFVKVEDPEILSKNNDPFAKSIDKVKEYQGLSATTKRRISRHIQKVSGGVAGENEPLAEGTGGAKSKARIDKFVTGYGAFDVVEPPYNLDYLSKIYEISPAHKAAVDAKVTNIVGLGYEFVESLATTEKLSEIEDEEQLKKARRKVSKGKRELEEWVESLNDEEPFLETLRKVVTDLESIGNGYFEVGRTTQGEIGYIGHLPASTVRRRVEKDGYVQIVAGRATFFRNYADDTVSDPVGDDPRPNEVIHLMKYTPTNSYYGVPDIVSSKNAVAGEEFAARFNLDYFEHKAVPRYIIVVKNARLSAQSEQRLVDFLQTGLRGQHHRTIYVPLPADSDGKQVEFKLEPVEANITDASFTKYKEMNRDEILLSHRVPLPQVGFGAGLSMGASRDSTKMFKEQVCRPMQDIIEKKLKYFFREKTNAFDFHLNELTLTDEETASRIHERHLRWGVLSPNEVRMEIGMSPREGGDDTVGVMDQAKERKPSSNSQPGMGPVGQQANQTRTREQERQGGPYSDNSDRSRNQAGEGRQTP